MYIVYMVFDRLYAKTTVRFVCLSSFTLLVRCIVVVVVVVVAIAENNCMAWPLFDDDFTLIEWHAPSLLLCIQCAHTQNTD